ncbi:uncharacterized protein LOC127247794 [Andrographis paniculata]|uniref:uncharacterized protein LOC127247794 n=1 Tax=Andrographis paniculata TaxID=175694 RepID=UPI0021E6FE97|nr:uncharacterized protein LOC127247794 [Andrographis paniculata]
MAQQPEKQGSAPEEEERPLIEEVKFLDIDMLCSAVAKQAHKGNWGKFNGYSSEEDDLGAEHFDYGGGVLRMWEGELVSGCFDDRRIALQSTCCPCYRFGKNMKRAGLGSCLLQGWFLLILAVIAMSNLLAFMITRRHCFLYLSISFIVSIGMYLGYHRVQIRKKFNIKDGDSSLDDCIYPLICPCCTLSQESRTLEMNNVQDGVWHGRGDTICIGNLSEDAPTAPRPVQLSPPSRIP